MAKNKDKSKEAVRNVINTEPEKLPEENICTSEPDIINTNQEIENMEVHQHAHNHGDKNWKTYIWEFLMLFLAVFCGFLAEYQLEHKIESNRERQYIESMVQDIKEDTVKMNRVIPRSTQKMAGLDSLLNNIYHTPYTDSSLRMMYHLNNYLHFRNEMLFTKRTITQLKNSGGLRLIRNMAASDSIVIYDEYCERTEKQFDNYFLQQFKARDFDFKIFDPRFSTNTLDPLFLIKTNTKVTLLNNNEKLMMEYANWVSSTNQSHKGYVTLLKNQKERGVRIMQFLQKEYHLE